MRDEIRSEERYSLMTLLGNYEHWTLKGDILRDAYGKGITDSPGYFEEKLGILSKGGILALWTCLDNTNRNRLLDGIRRYEERLFLHSKEREAELNKERETRLNTEYCDTP